MWWSAWWRHHTLMPKVGSRRVASRAYENATSEIAGLHESGNGREVPADGHRLWRDPLVSRLEAGSLRV